MKQHFITMSLFFRELSNKLVSWPFIIASNKNLLFLKIFRAKTIVDRKAKPEVKYSLQGTTQGNGLTGGLPPVRFSM